MPQSWIYESGQGVPKIITQNNYINGEVIVFFLYFICFFLFFFTVLTCLNNISGFTNYFYIRQSVEFGLNNTRAAMAVVNRLFCANKRIASCTAKYNEMVIENTDCSGRSHVVSRRQNDKVFETIYSTQTTTT